jgi:hypothetical protein
MKKVAMEVAERSREAVHYNNARARRDGFLLPGAQLLPQDAFFALPCHFI